MGYRTMTREDAMTAIMQQQQINQGNAIFKQL